MSDTVEVTGRCLCGSVTVTGRATAPKVAACQCRMCRRWSSGPYFEVTCTNVEFEGAERISTIRSSDWAERGFCSRCGSNLFYHIIDSDEFQISAGLLDEPSDLRLTLQVFTDEQPRYYTLADTTETMTGAEVFAKYAPPQE